MLILIFLHTMHTFTHQTIIVDQIRFTEAIKFGFYDFLTLNLYFSGTEATLLNPTKHYVGGGLGGLRVPPTHPTSF